jgi:hypothetical protein
MYRYTAYGLNICSAFSLPELGASHGAVDVVIRPGRLDYTPPADAVEYSFRRADGGVCLFWKDVGTFLVRDGREIIVDVVPGTEGSVLRLFLFGAVMGVLLHQRGLAVFHASAVEIDGKTVAFLGGKGWGKSTMAAALLAQGHQVVADDVMAVDVSHSGLPVALPAFPQLKLWPDAILSLKGDPESSPRLSSGVEKRAFSVRNGFGARPTPLSRVYVLGRGRFPEIEPLRPREALFELIRNYYPWRFGEQLLQCQERTCFLQCAEIARKVPVYLLKRPPDLQLLSATAQLVERHLTS